MVPASSGIDLRLPTASLPKQAFADGGVRRTSPANGAEIIPADRLAFVRERYAAQGLPGNVSGLLLEGSWRNTHRAYQSAWRCWNNWCLERSKDSVSPTLSQVLEYLTFLFDLGRSYRTINVHRSMLSGTLPRIETFEIGKHPLVCKLLKDIYNKRTPGAKYQ